ncbi:Nicotinate phosphoribosyltransferase [Portunus trituberculatus]|uniref:nicotinate phosphoribosyltransferase n=1 Tax=Portunus trituberculatus TaxID=210409 RepID=A0A5B7CIL3_PORTR|nr:Nicotinate phosphoribosyltransferase [Portunus trituberculatus]
MINRVEISSDRIRNSNSQNGVIQPLLTDLYQINMAYAYWKSGKHDDVAVFDLFFRKNPFQGEFTIFAGLQECLTFLQNFRYSESDIEYLRENMPPTVEPEYFEFLANLTTDEVTVYAVDEGKVVFPRVPLLVLEGPLIVIQLLETTLLTLVNYASLVATNAARYRMAAGRKMKLLEFGLRRAQGPDGGLSASKYAYLGESLLC